MNIVVFKISLTNSNPNGNVPSTTQITDENDCYDVANFIRAGYEARQARRDLKPLLYGRYYGINVTGAERLLQRHKER